MTRQNQYTAMSRFTTLGDIHKEIGWENVAGRDEYVNEYIPLQLKKTEECVTYERYCNKTCKRYIGKTDDIFRRGKEHSNTDCVCHNEMIEPQMRVLCKLFGNQRYFLDVEKQYIRKWKSDYGDELINLIGFKDVKMRSIKIDELKKDIVITPKIRVNTEEYTLTWHEKGVYKKKRFRNNENGEQARTLCLVFINENFGGRCNNRHLIDCSWEQWGMWYKNTNTNKH